MSKIKKVLLCIGGAIVSFLAGAVAVFIWLRGKKTAETSDTVKEASHATIENTSGADLVAAADNSAELDADINRIKLKFRERVRDKLNGIIQRDSSSGDNSGVTSGN